MTGTVKEIIDAKRRAGETAFLWLTHDGICALYDREEDSYESGTPVRRWELDPIEREQLIETGLIDGMGVLGCDGEDACSKVETICLRMLQENDPSDPTLFDRITNQLAAAGIWIDQEATIKGRGESPNVVAVFKTVDSDDRDYLEILNGAPTIWGYNGEIQTELLSFPQILHYYDDPPIGQEELAGLRYLERDGQKFYDEADLSLLSQRKEQERAARRESQRNLSLVLPDEFLALCEEVNATPAAILEGFIADLCHLETRPYVTNGSDERMFAEQYLERCGYRSRVEWEKESKAGKE